MALFCHCDLRCLIPSFFPYSVLVLGGKAKSDKFIEMFFRPPKKLTAKERVSNLMRSEYLSGIDGESKNKKRKKKKGQAEEEQ